MRDSRPTIVVVTRATRLQGLKQRWATKGAARFLLTQAHAIEAERRGAQPRGKRAGMAAATLADADFADYEREDDAYQRARDRLAHDLDFGLPLKFIDRSFLPTYDFWNCVAVVALGQDGLVANTAKYVGDVPIVAANPDPQRFDGILLPFRVEQVRRAVGRVIDKKHRFRPVTLAEAVLNDGQRLLAFNDLFIGCASHVSARYTLEVDGRSEPQSSSGVLVSTGAGSTGWLSSTFNMAAGVAALLGAQVAGNVRIAWEDRRLVWVVREPFASKHSRTGLVAGVLDDGRELVLESLMPSQGVIFSDGIEADFLQFTSGAIARISAAEQSANLVVD